jgi:transmembrane sensor
MRSPKQKFLSKKFKAYQNGHLPVHEKEIIDNWFDGKLAEAYTDPQETDPKDHLQAEELFEAIKQKIGPKRKISWYTNNWLRVACTLLVLTGLAMLFSRQQPQDHQLQITWQTFRTAKGEVKKITLADGSMIWMNAETRIRVNANFSTASTRQLKMDVGEAFFQVHRDTLRPFSIATGNIVTTVLGTSFNIKSYPELKTYKVAVASGKVKVAYTNGAKHNTLSKGLTKNQVLSYHHDTQKSDIKIQDVHNISQWRSNRNLFFDELNMAQIAAELSRQYNITVNVIGRQHADQTYTMQLEYQDISKVLQQIVLKTGITYQLSNKVLTLNTGI